MNPDVLRRIMRTGLAGLGGSGQIYVQDQAELHFLKLADFIQDSGAYARTPTLMSNDYCLRHYSYAVAETYCPDWAWLAQGDAVWSDRHSVHAFMLRYRCVRHSDCRESIPLSLECQRQPESIGAWYDWWVRSSPRDKWVLHIHPIDWGRLPPSMAYTEIPKEFIPTPRVPAKVCTDVRGVLWLRSEASPSLVAAYVLP